MELFSRLIQVSIWVPAPARLFLFRVGLTRPAYAITYIEIQNPISLMRLQWRRPRPVDWKFFSDSLRSKNKDDELEVSRLSNLRKIGCCIR
ncbi:hypothetical protein G4B88_018281 [Cannabis sativa]|uniref:Uncharacterized protein n=1 Tax=Cannabis sativa TaxID=3483 RepID=A0A7J6F344_CANSA|nr:hypothetical protein G4B88_018281 [Cannabis sativa]